MRKRDLALWFLLVAAMAAFSIWTRPEPEAPAPGAPQALIRPEPEAPAPGAPQALIRPEPEAPAPRRESERRVRPKAPTPRQAAAWGHSEAAR